MCAVQVGFRGGRPMYPKINQIVECDLEADMTKCKPIFPNAGGTDVIYITV